LTGARSAHWPGPIDHPDSTEQEQAALSMVKLPSRSMVGMGTHGALMQSA
jgi:hypothetical protein